MDNNGNGTGQVFEHKEPSSASRMEQLNQLLLSFHEAGRLLHQDMTVQALCYAVCRHLARTCGYSMVWIGRAHPAAKEVTMEAIAGSAMASFTRANVSWDETKTILGPVGMALNEGIPVIAEDLKNDARFAGWTDKCACSGAASLAAFPLATAGQLLGVLVVRRSRAGEFDETEIQLLTDLADDLATVWLGREVCDQMDRTQDILETLVEAIPDAVFFKDGKGRWQHTNQLAKQLFQLDRRPWLNRTDAELAEDLPEFRHIHLTCIASDEQAWTAGKMVVGEEIVQGPDGKAYTFEVFKVPMFYEDGRRKGLVIIGRDITDRLHTAQRVQEANARLAQMNAELESRVAERTRQLADSEETFRAIADSASSAIFLLDHTGRISFWNRAAEQMFGWRAAEVMGQDILRLLAVEENIFLLEQAPDRPRQLVGVAREKLEVTARRQDGGVFPLELALAVVPLRGRPHVVGLGNDISERREAEQELERYAWEVEDLYNRAPCGYHSLNAEGVIIRINHTELSWLGYTREEMLGRKLTDFYTPASREVFSRRFLGFTGEDRMENLELEFVRKDGSLLPVLLNSVAVRDAAGQFVRTRTTILDNTQRRLSQQALQRAMEMAAAANRAKTDFLATMSHEIRTPMNAIMGYAQLLRRQPDLPDPARARAEIICRNGQNLLSLLNSILELSQIEEGRVTMKPEVFSPRDLFTELVSLFHETAQSKQLTLEFLPGGGLPEFVEADQDKLRRALANLLSNALKFTQQGGVQLRLEAFAATSGHWRLVAEVRDTGPGINPEEMSQLFQRFAQTSLGRRTGTGTGLGLYISNEYVRLMGGHLTVHSLPGQGSSFRLELPARAAHGSVASSETSQLPVLPSGPGQPPVRILVVDDVADSREMLAQLLETVGFAVQTVGTGPEALELVTGWPPQLILVDAHMPAMDGGETIRLLRAQQNLPQPKVIMVSAAAFEWDRQAALAAGADDFVPKPYEDLGILEVIRRHLRLEYSTPAGRTAASMTALTPADLANLPADLRRTMRTAVQTADYDRLTPLLQQLHQQDPRLAQALATLADRFDAEGLLRLLSE